jgi:hypothetical protein
LAIQYPTFHLSEPPNSSAEPSQAFLHLASPGDDL